MIRDFDEFRETHLSFSPKCSTPEEIARAVVGYDAQISGRDQIWNFAQTPVFFLERRAPYGGKRTSYAPCAADLLNSRMSRLLRPRDGFLLRCVGIVSFRKKIWKL